MKCIFFSKENFINTYAFNFFFHVFVFELWTMSYFLIRCFIRKALRFFTRPVDSTNKKWAAAILWNHFKVVRRLSSITTSLVMYELLVKRLGKNPLSLFHSPLPFFLSLSLDFSLSSHRFLLLATLRN